MVNTISVTRWAPSALFLHALSNLVGRVLGRLDPAFEPEISVLSVYTHDQSAMLARIDNSWATGMRIESISLSSEIFELAAEFLMPPRGDDGWELLAKCEMQLNPGRAASDRYR